MNCVTSHLIASMVASLSKDLNDVWKLRRCKMLSFNGRSRRCLSWKKRLRISSGIVVMSGPRVILISWSKVKPERRKIGAHMEPERAYFHAQSAEKSSPKRMKFMPKRGLNCTPTQCVGTYFSLHLYINRNI